MVEWSSPVLSMRVNALFPAGIKLFPKTKREKRQETIKSKYSDAGKVQTFTFWALRKILPYCLRILKSTGDHICLKLWIIHFDLRKKKRTFTNQTTENENWQFWTSKCQPAQPGKVFRGLFHKKNGSPGKIGYRKHGWKVNRTDEGAGSTVGAGGKIYLLAAHEKHVSKGFDRSG